MYNKTNIDDIISSLNVNIYSIKEIDVTFNNEIKWNIKNLNINEEDLSSYITNRVINSTFVIEPFIEVENTDEMYYDRRRLDAETFFGLSWFLTLGLLLMTKITYDVCDYSRHLLVNKKMQSCKIVFCVRRITNDVYYLGT
jgi:hypothetical protein